MKPPATEPADSSTLNPQTPCSGQGRGGRLKAEMSVTQARPSRPLSGVYGPARDQSGSQERKAT